MKKILILIVSMAILLTTVACDKNDEEIKINDLMPNEIGNYWKYTGSGNEYADFEQKVLFEENGKMQVQLINPGTSSAIIYKFSEENISVVYAEDEFYEEKNILDSEENLNQVIVEAPIVEGTTWTQNGRIYKIENTKAFVETPSGNYENCVQIIVNYENQAVEESYYYKPKLGLVFQKYTDGDFVITSSLSEYKVEGFENIK